MLFADPRLVLKARISPETSSRKPRAFSAFSTHATVTGLQEGLGLGIEVSGG